MKAIRLWSTALAALLSLSLFVSCSDGENITSSDGNSEPPQKTVERLSDGYRLRSENWRLDIKDDGRAELLSGSERIFLAESPAAIYVKETEGEGYQSERYAAAYDAVETGADYISATARVSTKGGGTFAVTDVYRASSQSFSCERTVEVTSAGADEGFQSEIVFSAETQKSAEDYDYFVPAVIYRDRENHPNNSIAKGFTAERADVYIQETMICLPLVMIRDRASGYALALQHLRPEIDADGISGGGEDGAVNDYLRYGSLSVGLASGASVGMTYPCKQSNSRYADKNIFHSVRQGNSHAYTIQLIPSKTEEYETAVVDCFKTAYEAESPKIATEINIDEIYEDNIELFSKEYKEFGTGSIPSAGLPFQLDLPDGGKSEGYSFQMGFIGQQTSVAYHLLYAGYEKNDASLIKKGETMMNFWTSNLVMGNALPAVWWQPGNNDSGGAARIYPAFLRCMIDGAEGMLDAYNLQKSKGKDVAPWKNAVLKIGRFLVEHQNPDGSYYRAYNTDGSVCTDTSDARYQGTSKYNTPMAVRFLGKLYEFTGDEGYKTAALKAAEYSYETLYKQMGKYVGGTPDNPNIVDKEAALYALYCFDTAYVLTGDKKYLASAEHAAVCFMSFVYAYDFAVPATAENAKVNPFAEGGVIGFSVIAAYGGFAADNYAAVAYYAMYRLYLFTGDEFYYHCALLLEYNTKLACDYDGRMGYAYRAMCPEATSVANFQYGGSNAWLPWCGVVNIEPILKTYKTFRSADLLKITKSLDEQRTRLAAYGIGGRL